jgi:hypothetical protein
MKKDEIRKVLIDNLQYGYPKYSEDTCDGENIYEMAIRDCFLDLLGEKIEVIETDEEDEDGFEIIQIVRIKENIKKTENGSVKIIKKEVIGKI